MPQLTPIDFSNWERSEIFTHFRGTTMYTTVNIDVGNFLLSIKEKGIRFYPAMIYCVCKVINDNLDYRYAYDDEKDLCVWDVLHPMYTLPRKDNPHLFTMAVTEYDEDFLKFYDAFLDNYSKAEVYDKLIYNPDGHKNIMGITAMPGLHFSSFAFGSEIKPDFTPFTILGKYENNGGKVMLPVCGEFAHSVNDGYHITRFFKQLEENIQTLGKSLL